MAIGAVMPSPNFQGLKNGVPVAGGLLYTYAAGTIINKTTYQDSALTVPHANPIVLDSEGKAVVFLSDSSYKFKLTTSLGILVDPYPVDNIISTHLGSNSTGPVWDFGGDPNVLIVGTAYPVGATFAECIAGSSFFTADSANLVGDFVIEGMASCQGGETITVGLFNLTGGAPNTPIATFTTTDAVGLLRTSGLITWPAAGVTYTYGIKAKVTASGGNVWMVKLVQQ